MTAQEPVAAQIAGEYPGWDVTSGPLGLEARRNAEGEVVRAVSPAGMRELLSSYPMTPGGRQAGREHGQNILRPRLGLSPEELERQVPRGHTRKGHPCLCYPRHRTSHPPTPAPRSH